MLFGFDLAKLVSFTFLVIIFKLYSATVTLNGELVSSFTFLVTILIFFA